MKRRWFGLRARVIIAFSVGALLLSTLLATVTFSITRANLIESRKDNALSSAEVNAIRLNGQLSDELPEDQLVLRLEDLATAPGSHQAMLYRTRLIYPDPVAFGDEEVPTRLVDSLAAGRPATMTYSIDEAPYHVVGLPLPGAEANAYYILASPLADVEEDLNSLRLTLLGASAVTAMLGTAFGVYVATRLFSPIAAISRAAGQITAGDLATRLDDVADPDLSQLVGSFNEMTSALQHRIERDARFASDVSHELRSPLMTLTGSVAVLERRRDELPERSQLALDLLSNDIRRFKQLVEDLLEISRFDVGAVALETEEVLLGEFVRQAVQAAVGRDRSVPILYHNDSDDCIVEIDKRRIAQVIRNLSENADKYAGGLTQVHLVRDDHNIRIELEDEGPGVPVDERELIFDRFARGTEGGRRGSGSGVGLGLSLVKEHLRLHHGDVWVTDRVDRLLGSRFVVSLPNVVVE